MSIMPALHRMWGTLMADVVIQMLGTDYARILRAIYAFAQVQYGVTQVLAFNLHTHTRTRICEPTMIHAIILLCTDDTFSPDSDHSFSQNGMRSFSSSFLGRISPSQVSIWSKLQCWSWCLLLGCGESIYCWGFCVQFVYNACLGFVRKGSDGYWNLESRYSHYEILKLLLLFYYFYSHTWIIFSDGPYTYLLGDTRD